jgi:hypothetical protein
MCIGGTFRFQTAPSISAAAIFCTFRYGEASKYALMSARMLSGVYVYMVGS